MHQPKTKLTIALSKKKRHSVSDTVDASPTKLLLQEPPRSRTGYRSSTCGDVKPVTVNIHTTPDKRKRKNLSNANEALVDDEKPQQGLAQRARVGGNNRQVPAHEMIRRLEQAEEEMYPPQPTNKLEEDNPSDDLKRFAVKAFPILLALTVSIVTILCTFQLSVAFDESDNRNVLTVWSYHLCGPDTLATYGTWVEAYCHQLAPDYFPLPALTHLRDDPYFNEISGNARGDDRDLSLVVAEMCGDLVKQRLITLVFAVPSTVWAVLGNLVVTIYAFLWLKPAISPTSTDTKSDGPQAINHAYAYMIAAGSFAGVAVLTIPLWYITELTLLHRYCGAKYSLAEAGWRRGSAPWWLLWVTIIGSLVTSVTFLYLHQRAKKKSPCDKKQ